MWFQLVYLYCATSVPNRTLGSARVLEITPAYLTEAECHRQQADIPREAKVERDPRSGYAIVTCASREDIRREAQKSETELMKHMEPPAETPMRSGGQIAG